MNETYPLPHMYGYSEIRQCDEQLIGGLNAGNGKYPDNRKFPFPTFESFRFRAVRS